MLTKTNNHQLKYEEKRGGIREKDDDDEKENTGKGNDSANYGKKNAFVVTFRGFLMIIFLNVSRKHNVFLLAVHCVVSRMFGAISNNHLQRNQRENKDGVNDICYENYCVKESPNDNSSSVEDDMIQRDFVLNKGNYGNNDNNNNKNNSNNNNNNKDLVKDKYENVNDDEIEFDRYDVSGFSRDDRYLFNVGGGNYDRSYGRNSASFPNQVLFFFLYHNIGMAMFFHQVCLHS